MTTMVRQQDMKHFSSDKNILHFPMFIAHIFEGSLNMKIYDKILLEINYSSFFFVSSFFTAFFFFLAPPFLIKAPALKRPYLSWELESACKGRILAESFSLVVTSSCTASLSWVRRKLGFVPRIQIISLSPCCQLAECQPSPRPHPSPSSQPRPPRPCHPQPPVHSQHFQKKAFQNIHLRLHIGGHRVGAMWVDDDLHPNVDLVLLST